MPFFRQLIESIVQARLAASKVILLVAHLTGYSVGSLETNAPNIIRKFIWIAFHCFNAFLSILLVYLCCIRRTHTITLQEEHDILYVLLLFPTFLDFLDSFLANANNLIKPFYVGFNYINGFCSKLLNNQVGKLWAYSLYKTRTKIFLNPIYGRWHNFLPRFDNKLISKTLIYFPIPIT